MSLKVGTNRTETNNSSIILQYKASGNKTPGIIIERESLVSIKIIKFYTLFKSIVVEDN